MRLGIVALIVLSFISGLYVATLLEEVQLPRSPLGAERASPQDWISEEDIRVTNEGVFLSIPNARWATFANTNSMDPVLDEGSNGIQIVPQCPEQLQIGDVITYDYRGDKIIHRIVEIGQDAKGYYFIVKGDNNPTEDPEPVRCEQIDRVLVAVIY